MTSEGTKMIKTPAMTDKVKLRIGYALSFLIPVFILIGLFIGREIYPFGDNIYLRSDMYHQYAPFYKELYRKLTEGGSLTFSWNIGMGVNFTALYSYYLASPVNLLLGLLAPTGNILFAMDFLIVIKVGLCGLTCGYYLNKRYGENGIIFAAISVFYALSSYVAAYSWNIMWLDCLVLLPLIILGVDRIVKENKYLLYTIALGVSIFSNYYISIMICIYLVFYFAVRMLVTTTASKKEFFISRIISFIKGSLIAGGIGACMILPELAALSYTASGEFNFPEVWENYFSILDMLSRSLMNVEVSIFNAHDPNLYCTVAVFMFVPLYFCCNKINIKEKYGTGFLIVFFLICFNTNIPNYIFHGLHFPNSLPARESFIYIFLLVTVVYQVVIHIQDFSKKQLWGSFGGAIALMLLIEELYVEESTYPFEIVYLSMIFLSLYMLVVLGLRNKKINKTFMTYLLFIVCIAEAVTNSDHEASYKPTGYSSYLEDNEAIEKLVDGIEDDSFYRIEKLTRKTKNDAAWNDYYGVSIFSSTANASFTDMLGRLGFEKSTNAYSYYGNTPFTSALLSVKYVFSNNLIDEPYLMSLYSSDAEASRYLYKLDYTLPLAFMLPDDFMDNWVCEGNNPFAVQNSFVQSATGYTGMFTQVSAQSNGSSVTIEPTEKSDVYIYVTNYVDSISWNVEDSNGNYTDSGSASGLNHRQIVHIGEVTADSIITVTTSDSDVTSLQLYAYNFHQDVCDLAIKSLSSESFEITEFEDTYIKGTVNASEAGLLYTSIIYDRGWSVYVDGKEVELKSINDALCAVSVPAGSHTIEFEYSPTSLVPGLIITFISLAILIFLIVCAKKGIKLKFDFSKSSKKKIYFEKITDDASQQIVIVNDDNSDSDTEISDEADAIDSDNASDNEDTADAPDSLAQEDNETI